MKPLEENRGLHKCLKWFMVGLIAMVFELLPFGESLEIVPFPSFTVSFM